MVVSGSCVGSLSSLRDTLDVDATESLRDLDGLITIELFGRSCVSFSVTSLLSTITVSLE
jgi:hypothetical protein